MRGCLLQSSNRRQNKCSILDEVHFKGKREHVWFPCSFSLLYFLHHLSVANFYQGEPVSDRWIICIYFVCCFIFWAYLLWKIRSVHHWTALLVPLFMFLFFFIFLPFPFWSFFFFIMITVSLNSPLNTLNFFMHLE